MASLSLWGQSSFTDVLAYVSKWGIELSGVQSVKREVIQVYALNSNTEEAEVEQFYEDLQDLLEHPKKMSFSL